MKEDKQVDVMLARATQLPNEELYALYEAIGKEIELRRDAEQAADWKRVQEALTDYSRKWGTIIVQDYRDDDTLYLEHGHYTFDGFGEIAVE